MKEAEALGLFSSEAAAAEARPQPLLPFPTRLVADALHNSSSERVFVTMYGLCLLAIRILGFSLDAYARREHLYPPKEDGEELQSKPRQVLPVLVGYVIAILIGLALPSVAVAAYFALAVYLVLPFREIHRSRSRFHSSRQHGSRTAAPIWLGGHVSPALPEPGRVSRGP